MVVQPGARFQGKRKWSQRAHLVGFDLHSCEAGLHDRPQSSKVSKATAPSFECEKAGVSLCDLLLWGATFQVSNPRRSWMSDLTFLTSALEYLSSSVFKCFQGSEIIGSLPYSSLFRSALWVIGV